MTTRTANELAVLAVVASDASYVDPTLPWPFTGADPNPPLQSYPDNKLQEDEFGFAPSLVTAFDGATDPALDLVFQDNYLAPVSRKSGIGVIEFPNWHLVKEIPRNTGFGVCIYKQDGVDEYIVALRGTDGRDLKDWDQNLRYATDAWRDAREPLLDFLFTASTETEQKIIAKGVIHFAGQSLGGGLAQYAAYDFVRRAQDGTRNNGVQYDSSRISLTTFNGFGGVQGLIEMQTDSGLPFDPSLLARVQTAHYGMANDIVHRLGGAHLNGSGNTYEIGFRRRGDSGQPLADSDERGFMGIVDAHRIESGFYQGFDLYQTDFLNTARITPKDFGYLDVDAVQPVAAFFARMFGGKDPKLADKGPGVRLALGLVGGSVLGDPVQVARLYSEVIDAAYRGNDIGEAGRFGFGLLNIGLFLGNVLSNLVPAVAASRLVFRFADLFNASSDEKKQIQDGINTMTRPGDPAPMIDPSTQGSISDDQKAELFKLDAMVITAKLRPDLIDSVFAKDEQARLVAHEIAEIDVDLDAFSEALVGSSPNAGDAMRVLGLQAQATYLAQSPGAEGWKKVEQFGIALASALQEDIQSQRGKPISVASLESALNDFVIQDLGQALANAKSDFTDRYQLAQASVFGNTQFDFIDYSTVHDALLEAREDPGYASIRALIDRALETVNAAGETVVIRPGHSANPFNDPSFDPDADPAPESTVTEGGAKSYTVFLPYAAGEGGQHVAFKLEGAAAGAFTVLLGDVEIDLSDDGGFDLLVEEGQRSIVFLLREKDAVDQDGALTLSATLEDAEGLPTHQTHLELNLNLDVADDAAAIAGSPYNDRLITTFDSQGPLSFVSNVYSQDGQPYDAIIHVRTPGAGPLEIEGGDGRDVLYTTVDGNGVQDEFDSGDDTLYGGVAEDWSTLDTQAATGAGGDLLSGLAGNDLLVGSAGRDLLFGGNDEDTLLGGADDDALFGDDGVSGANPAFHSDWGFRGDPNDPFSGSLYASGSAYFFVMPAHRGGADFLDGGAGNDFLFGQAGDDVLLGGLGNDTLSGGAGDDVLFGGDGDDFMEGDSKPVDAPVVAVGLGYNLSGIFVPFGQEHTITAPVLTGISAEELVGNDYLDGGAGNDHVYGQAGNDTLIGGADSDHLYGDRFHPASVLAAVELAGDDYLDGGAGDDFLYGDDGNDVLVGGLGADYLDGGKGDDVIVFGAGDTVIGGPGQNIYRLDTSLGAGSVQFQSVSAQDTIQFDEATSPSNVSINLAYTGANSSASTMDVGDVLLVFAWGRPQQFEFDVEGSMPYQGLPVLGAEIRVSGDTARNNLIAGDEDDVYLLAPGSGHDTILDFGGADRIRFAAGVTSESLIWSYDPFSATARFQLSYGDAGDRVGIVDGEAGAMESFEFDDGSTLAFDALIARQGGFPPAAEDNVYDIELASVNEGSGLNYIYDFGGIDRVRFGAGITPESLVWSYDPRGFPERFRVYFGDEGDRLDIADGEHGAIESFEFSDGSVLTFDELLARQGGLPEAAASGVYIYQQDALTVGTPGDDFLEDGDEGDVAYYGGKGNDFVATYEGRGTYKFIFQRGDGLDYIEMSDPIDAIIEFGPGIAPEDLRLRVFNTDGYNFPEVPNSFPSGLLSSDLQIAYGDGDRVVVRDALGSTPVAHYAFQDGETLTQDELIERIGFAAAPVGSLIYGPHQMSVFGTSSDDRLVSDPNRGGVFYPSPDDFMRGLEGNDWLESFGGDDTLYGDEGADVLKGGEGADELYADATYADAASNVLDGGPGDDYLDSSIGDDVLIGGAGNDLIYPDLGNDVILWNSGDGTETLGAYWTDAALAGEGGDTLSLGRIDPNEIRLKRVAQALELRVGDDPVATVDDWYDDSGLYRSVDRLQLVGPLQGSGQSAMGTQAFGALSTEEETATGLPQAQVLVFDFQALADGFDAYLAANPGADTWTPSEELGEFLLWTSDTEAIGGEIAFRYAYDGSLEGLSADRLSALISVANFGTTALTVTNHAPEEVNGLFAEVVEADQAFVYSVPGNTFADADAFDRLTFTATLAGGQALPGWLSFDSASVTLNGTASVADAGSYSIAITATDTGGLSAQALLSLTVQSGANQVPVLVTAIEDQTTSEDSPFQFIVPAQTFSDADPGDSLSYSASRADGTPLPEWLSFNSTTQEFSGTPLNADVGSLDVKVTATDGSNAFASDVFTVTVANTNDAPQVANALADQTAHEDSAFSLEIPAGAFADPDAGDSLTYAATRADGTPLPGWLSFDAAAAAFSGTPLQADVGALEVRVTATDVAGLSASDSFLLSVLNVNDAPQVANALADQTAHEDSAFSLQIPADAFADPDAGDVLTYAATRADGTVLPTWLSFDAVARAFSGTPLQADVGALEVRVTATDLDGLSASDSFLLSVLNVNDAPQVANALADQAFDAGSPFVFSVPAGSFVDPDGESLALTAALFDGGALPAWLGFDAASGTFTGNPQLSSIGISHIAVTASDASGEAATSDFGLIVRAVSGSEVIGGAGDDVIYGNTGDEILRARGGSDYLFGDLGDDLLRGGAGEDVLQGGAGSDVLRGGLGQNVLDGGEGNDLIYGGAGSGFIAGGRGNDTLRVGTGNDVISFNLGDGSDTLYGGRDGGNTLSLGGGIRYQDLSLSKSGTDLILRAGANDQMVLKNWYGGNHSVSNLQLILDATDQYDPAASDGLYNRKVQTFDFLGLVQAFNQARAATPGLSSWAVTNALLQFHLSGADDFALGGDLAYWYAKKGNLNGISLAAAQQVIGAAGFGADAQSLHPFAGLQEGFVKLA